MGASGFSSLVLVTPVAYEKFKKSFDSVFSYLENGEVELINLTFQTEISPISLKEVDPHVSPHPLRAAGASRVLAHMGELAALLQARRAPPCPVHQRRTHVALVPPAVFPEPGRH